MTGYEVYRRAAALLGYYDDGISRENEGFSGESMVFINRILSDLGCEEISSPTDEISLSSANREALVSGVAMLTALAIADMTKAEEFRSQYQKKRSAALSDICRISDLIPSPLED